MLSVGQKLDTNYSFPMKIDGLTSQQKKDTGSEVQGCYSGLSGGTGNMGRQGSLVVRALD